MLGIQVNHNEKTLTFCANQNVGKFIYQFKEA